MMCKVDISDCITFDNAIHKLHKYRNIIRDNIDEYTESYGKDYVLTKVARDNFDEITKISDSLSEIQDKCNCRFSRDG